MSRLLRVTVGLAVVLAIVAFSPATSWAQLTRGSIAGTVRDASGAVVPGATVTVTDMQTNAARVATTDGEGFYRVPALEPGRYMVVVELQGFSRVEQKEIQVRAASETSIDVALKLASVGETITVSADSSTVSLNKNNPTIAFTTNERAVVELPLAGGRNINNLILTVPNASSTTGQGTFAVNGQRPRNNNYMVDGSDNNDISVTISTSQLVPESVAEFQVMQNPYSVEFGRNSGGQINVITRSGSNQLRGDAWDYYQASGLSSRTNIEKGSSRTDPARLIRHQVGGGAGGPILKDRAFFFGLYQLDTQRPGSTPAPTVRIPTQAGFAALQGAPIGPGQSAASRQAVLDRLGFLQDIYGQNLTFQSVNSATLVNGTPIETGNVNANIVSPSTYHTWLGRGDVRMGASDNFTVRYSLNDRTDDNLTTLGNCVFGDVFCANQDLMDTNLAVSNTHILSNAMLNEARFSFVRRNLDFPENDPNSPTAVISGLFTVGGNTNFPQSRVSDAYQFSDTVSWTLAKHTLKFGADLRYNRVDNVAGFNTKGSFTFDNLQAYMNNFASQFTQALQTASWFATQWQTFWFAQDDFRVTPDLTVNLGLRYEISGVPLGLFGATDPESLSAGVPGPVEKDTNNWAPRAGFAWSPRTQNRFIGDGRTVFRGGFGMGYDIVFYNLLTVNGNNFPRVFSGNVLNVQDVYPNIATSSGAPTFNPLNQWVNSAQNTVNPETRFYSFTVQRELGTSYLVEVGYSGSRGYKGINQIEGNPAILTPAQAALVAATGSSAGIPSAQARRVDPNIGSRILIPAYDGPAGNDVEARSEYNAVFVSGTRRFTRGLQFTAGYTYSRWYSNNDGSLGEGGTDASSQRPQSMFDYAAEWSRSQFDRPHRFTTSYIWEIPGPKTGILGQTLGGWQISGVTQGQSGRPFTVVTGVDSNGDTNGGSDRPNVNPAGTFMWDDRHRGFTNNGFYVAPLGSNNLPLQNSLGDGNAPRNQQRTAGFWNTDLSLSKRFPIGQTVRFLVRIDALNVFNQDNYNLPVVNMSSVNFGQNLQNWGRRIVVLSGKVSF